MIEQQGRVTRLDGQLAAVQVGARTGCRACEAGEGCGAGIFGRLLGRGETEVLIPNVIGAGPGQAVILALPETTYLGLVLRMYAAPLLAGLAGALVVYPLFGLDSVAVPVRDAASLGAGLLAAGLALAVVRRGFRAGLSELEILMVGHAPGRVTCSGAGVEADPGANPARAARPLERFGKQRGET